MTYDVAKVIMKESYWYTAFSFCNLLRTNVLKFIKRFYGNQCKNNSLFLKQKKIDSPISQIARKFDGDFRNKKKEFFIKNDINCFTEIKKLWSFFLK